MQDKVYWFGTKRKKELAWHKLMDNNNGIMGQSLWLVASVLANPMTPWLLKMTNLMTLYPTKSLVYGDTSSLIT